MHCTCCGKEKKIATKSQQLCAACYTRRRKQSGPPNAVCSICGTSFRRRHKKAREFCSKLCYRKSKLGRTATLEETQVREQPCPTCGAPVRAVGWQIDRGEGIYCSLTCRSIRKRKYKEWSPIEKVRAINSWRTGRGWRRFRTDLLRVRGAYCERCGNTSRPCVHHIVDPDQSRDEELLLDPNNCVVLCTSCHVTLHAGRWNLREILS